MQITLDIETKCNHPECNGKTFKGRECKHALHPKYAKITCVGLYWKVQDRSFSKVFRDLNLLKAFLDNLPKAYTLLGHNFKG